MLTSLTFSCMSTCDVQCDLSLLPARRFEHWTLEFQHDETRARPSLCLSVETSFYLLYCSLLSCGNLSVSLSAHFSVYLAGPSLPFWLAEIFLILSFSTRWIKSKNHLTLLPPYCLPANLPSLSLHTFVSVYFQLLLLLLSVWQCVLSVY